MCIRGKHTTQERPWLSTKENNEDNWEQRLPNLSYHGIFPKTYHILCENCMQKLLHLYPETWRVEPWNRINWETWRANSLTLLSHLYTRDNDLLCLVIQELLNDLTTDPFHFSLRVHDYTIWYFMWFSFKQPQCREILKKFLWRSTGGLYAFIHWLSGNPKFFGKALTMRGALWEISFFEGHSRFWENLILPIKWSIDQVLCQQWIYSLLFFLGVKILIVCFPMSKPRETTPGQNTVIICS